MSNTGHPYRELRYLKRLLVRGTLPLLGLAFVACVSRKTDQELEVLVGSEPATLDPRFATRGLDVKLTRLIHAGLVSLDPHTLEPRPYLARSLLRRNDLQIEIELEPDARFHSGKPLDPHDVCATVAAVRDPRLGSPHRSILEAFVRCEPTGPHTLTLGLATPRATWMSDLEMPILRASEAQSPARTEGSLDGLGPFRITAYEQGVIRLQSDSRRQSHRVNGLVVRTVHDENARAMRLISGRAEIATNAFSPSLLSGFEGRPGIVVKTRPGANVTYLLVRCDRPPFDRVELRRALSWSINRDEIVSHLLAGKARAAKWLIPDGHWAAPTSLPPLEYTPEQARPLLSALPKTTLLTSTDRSRILQARAIAQMFSDVGLETQVIPLDLGLLLSRLDAGQFSLAILQIPELTEPNLLSWFFHPRGIGENRAQGRNRARYRNLEVAHWLDAASHSFDTGERRDLYVRVAGQMLSDLPVIPLWHEDHVVVARGRGTPFEPSAEGRWAALADL